MEQIQQKNLAAQKLSIKTKSKLPVQDIVKIGFTKKESERRFQSAVEVMKQKERKLSKVDLQPEYVNHSLSQEQSTDDRAGDTVNYGPAANPSIQVKYPRSSLPSPGHDPYKTPAR